MKQGRKLLMLLFFSLFFFAKGTLAAPGDSVVFTPLGKYSFSSTYSGYTPLIDRLNRPYVYLATKELGLVTFSILDPLNPLPVDTIPVSALGNLKVTGVTQDSIFLFLSLGDFQGGGQNAGLAIYDVSDPLAPQLLDQWDSTAFVKGTSSVIRSGNFAYLSAMESGVLILDVSDKLDIRFVKQFIPDPTFGPHSYTYHSRGLFLSGDTLLVADDNGGLRIVDVTDKQNPVEIGKYVNTTINSTGAAYYNHIYRIGSLVFCAMDFCGFETVDISNPSQITSVAWLNPWNCTNQPPPFGSWLGSDGHTNEVVASATQTILFFSGGDSQILAFDPGDPAQPGIIGAWGPANDTVGSWGVDVWGHTAALANIYTPGFPFLSTVGGLQLLDWQVLTGIDEHGSNEYGLQFSPNPFSSQSRVTVRTTLQDARATIYNSLGEFVRSEEGLTGNSFVLDRKGLSAGIYFLRILAGQKSVAAAKFMVID